MQTNTVNSLDIRRLSKNRKYQVFPIKKKNLWYNKNGSETVRLSQQKCDTQCAKRGSSGNSSLVVFTLGCLHRYVKMGLYKIPVYTHLRIR